MSTLRTLYPEIDPYEVGALEVGEGHVLHWERIGTPGGKPAVFLHGGPGGGCTSNNRRLFDPSVYDVLLFDQRGCGRSTPHASLDTNTTWHLVGDIERLREMTGADRWLVFGGSWGATLALAYAQRHVERVSELIVRGFTSMSPSDLHWCYQHGVSQIFPDAWESFIVPIPAGERTDLFAAYRRRILGGGTPEEAEAAAVAWCRWEGATSQLMPNDELTNAFSDPRFAHAMARIEIHYLANRCWLEEGQLLRGAARLKGIPGSIIHGRYDMPCQARSAWELHKAWPQADFHLVEGAGHAGSEPGMLHRLIEATDRYAASWKGCRS